MLQAAKTAGLDALSPRDSDVLRELEVHLSDPSEANAPTAP
jgi:hypothetical protein